MNRFSDKIVLITGGTRGIGRVCAERFVAEGATLALCGRDPEKAAQAAQEIGNGAVGFGCDVSNSESVNALVANVEKQFGRIDVLVNNAGITRPGLLARMKDEDFNAVIQTNLNGVFHLCRATARGMMNRRYGRIVNISSILGFRGQAGLVNYCASKAAIIGFSVAYAREIGSRNITVNVVAPGYTETDMTIDTAPEGEMERIIRRTPMGRLGQPNDMTGAVAFLASDDASFITGAVLTVDGGLSA